MHEQGSDEPIKLVWTFAGGESIRADNVAWNQGEFQFSAQSAGDTQEVTLTFNKSKGIQCALGHPRDWGISLLRCCKMVKRCGESPVSMKCSGKRETSAPTMQSCKSVVQLLQCTSGAALLIKYSSARAFMSQCFG